MHYKIVVAPKIWNTQHLASTSTCGDKRYIIQILAGLLASNKYLAGPKGQHKISSWPKGPAQDLWQPEAAHDLVVARGHNFLSYRKIEKKLLKMLLSLNGLNIAAITKSGKKHYNINE